MLVAQTSMDIAWLITPPSLERGNLIVVVKSLHLAQILVFPIQDSSLKILIFALPAVEDVVDEVYAAAAFQAHHSA